MVKPPKKVSPSVKNSPANVRAQFDVNILTSAASSAAGYSVAPGDVALVLMNTSIDDLYDKHTARVYWDLWDKKTPINGVPAKKVLGRSDYTGGEIYLVWIDDNLTILQPHKPYAGAPMEADEVHEVASLHAAEIVDELVMTELLGLVVTESTPPQPAITMEDLQELLATPRGRRLIDRGQ